MDRYRLRLAVRVRPDEPLTRRGPANHRHMRIGIDARFYGSLGKGLGRYTSELIAHLERIDQENDYLIFLREGNWNEYRPRNQRFRKVLAEYPWYSWREQLLYPRFLNRFRLDLVHFPHFNVPLFYRRPFVVTIHDLILLHSPTTRATTLGPLRFRLKYLFYRLAIRQAIARAKTVITVSQHTKKEIEGAFPFAKQKDITVTYEACSPRLLPTGDSGPIDLPVAALPQPFMLYVGNAYPHKNLEALLAAFRNFRESGHPEYHLVLVGSEDYFYRRLKTESASRGDDEQVIFFGRATDRALGQIYDRASFYVFPSLHEGFGLPPLEALCRGLPVASSNATCLPEILGRAALFFDPKKPETILSAMRRLAEEEHFREELRRRGFRRVRRYSWQDCAEKTRDIYEKAISMKDHVQR